MNPVDTILVVGATRSVGVCKFCRRPVVWVVMARQGAGQRARSQPFDSDVTAVDVVVDANNIRFERWPAAKLHGKSCRNRPKPDPTRRRMREDSRRGQGRMW